MRWLRNLKKNIVVFSQNLYKGAIDWFNSRDLDEIKKREIELDKRDKERHDARMNERRMKVDKEKQ